MTVTHVLARVISMSSVCTEEMPDPCGYPHFFGSPPKAESFLCVRRCLRRGALRDGEAGGEGSPGGDLATLGRQGWPWRASGRGRLRAAPFARLRCAARSGGASPNSLRCAPFRQRRRVRQRSALRAPPPALRCSPRPMSRQGQPCHPGWRGSGWWGRSVKCDRGGDRERPAATPRPPPPHRRPRESAKNLNDDIVVVN